MIGAVLVLALAPPPERVFKPCAKEEPAWTSARSAGDALDARIKALAPGEDATAALSELDRILAGDCHALLRQEQPGLAMPKSTESLKAWWEAGGREWIRWPLSPIAFSRTVAGTTGLRDVLKAIIPPTPRLSLAAKHDLTPATREILCPAESDSCGNDTAGWLKRAHQTFRLAARIDEPGVSRSFPLVVPDCDTSALNRPDEFNRYAFWRRCVEQKVGRQEALPLGRFRAPTEGLLAILDIGGHGDWSCRTCDELRVYDVASGAAWIAHRCRCADPMHGSDYVCAEYAESRARQTGRVAVDALREALWMLLLMPHVQENARLELTTLEIPHGIQPTWPDKPEARPSFVPSEARWWDRIAASDSGRLAGFGKIRWAWVRKGALIAASTLPTAGSFRSIEARRLGFTPDAASHGAVLVEVAEATFVEAAPEPKRAAEPASEAWAALGGMRVNDSEKRMLMSLIDALRIPPAKDLKTIANPREQ